MTARAATIAAAMWYQAIPIETSPVSIGGTDFTVTLTSAASVSVTATGDVDVYWDATDDSITETVSDETVVHTYAEPSTVTVVLRANACTGFTIVSSGLTAVTQWGNMSSSYEAALQGNTALTDVPATKPPVTSLASLFYGCSTLNDSDIASWDVSTVTDMNLMFRDCAAFNQDISGWDVSACTDLSGMFRGATVFNQDISGWQINASVVTSGMANMFRDAAAFNQDLAHWRVDGIASEPTNFSTGTTAWNDTLHPIWGYYPVLLKTEDFTGSDDDDLTAEGWTLLGENTPAWTVQTNQGHLSPDWHAYTYLDTDPGDSWEATFKMANSAGAGSGFNFFKFGFNLDVNTAATNDAIFDQGITLEVNGDTPYWTLIDKGWHAVAYDTFGRSSSGSAVWGDSVGGTWARSGGADEDYYTNGSVGIISVDTAGSSRRIINYPTSSTDDDMEILTKVRFDYTSTGSDGYAEIYLRYTDISNHYIARLHQESGGGNSTLSLRKRVAGSTSTIDSGSSIGDATDEGEWFWFRARIEGTTLSAKAWSVGTEEPSSWTVSTTDSDLATGDNGGVGAWKGSSGNTNSFPVEVSFDDFTFMDSENNEWQQSENPTALQWDVAGGYVKARIRFTEEPVRTLWMKLWDDGDPEPTSWNKIDENNTQFWKKAGSQMGFGISGTSGTDDLLVDDFEVWNLT